MRSEYRDLPPGDVPRKTKTPRRRADLEYDEDLRRSTGVYRYYETIDEENMVDLGDTGEEVETYWAEGWTTRQIAFNRGDCDSFQGKHYRTFPVRYRVDDFILKKSLRRVLAKSNDLTTVFRPLRITPKKEELFYQHICSRFSRVPGPLSKMFQYTICWGIGTYELSVFHPNGSLVALSIVQRGRRGSYSDTAAWSPEYKTRSLGTFTLLKEIEIARASGFTHHYIGHTFLANPNYSYKLRFPGAEIYDWDANVWIDARDPCALLLMEQAFPTRLWDPGTGDWLE